MDLLFGQTCVQTEGGLIMSPSIRNVFLPSLGACVLALLLKEIIVLHTACHDLELSTAL